MGEGNKEKRRKNKARTSSAGVCEECRGWMWVVVCDPLGACVVRVVVQ